MQPLDLLHVSRSLPKAALFGEDELLGRSQLCVTLLCHLPVVSRYTQAQLVPDGRELASMAKNLAKVPLLHYSQTY